MIKVSAAAIEFLGGVIKEQDVHNLHLKATIQNPGTPAADCHLSFCEKQEVQVGYEEQDLGDFNLYVAHDDLSYFEDAEIDYETKGASGQLNIKAPNIKGETPGDDAPIFDRLAYFIDAQINPMLASHGGNARLVAVEDDKAVIEFGGGCHGCGMAKQTLSQGMETQITAQFPEISQVVDATDHSTGENPYY
ncbi:Fe/S biogenesis protein NfuA [Marinicella pacifica]|uniref:Fe/S biogenesis protein NfuA n=1 Tax=Marinicella pacifica TaxID=1171543 RepID=A0A917CXF9_9GAMM|nr:NifU family protein [Marinicella pacifica]GGG00315.1 Fe/S biogenesis protein NfuA [Marinicella pacifica]